MKSRSHSQLPLPPEFAAFQGRCAKAAAHRPDMPTDLILLSRLSGYVAMRMEEAFDRLLEPWGLTSWSWLALMMSHWCGEDEFTPTAVSRTLFLPRANVTRVTDELVRRGLLHRQPSVRDRRVLELSLTETGRALVEEILPHAWATHRAIWSEVAPDRLEDARNLLAAIAKGIDSLSAGPAAVSPKEQA